MKINPRIFSFPPYISTSWNNVVALHMKATTLTISLVDGDIIEIPDLKPELIELIFAAHAAFLEYDIARDHSHTQHQQSSKIPEKVLDVPIHFGLASIDEFGSALQHNPAQSGAPDIPREILQKIGAIAKIVSPEDTQGMPKAEPHCNCMHCQITRAISSAHEGKEKDEELPVTDEDLKFQEWTIEQAGDKLFTVTNRLDTNETYRVFLGDPVGCTCGKPGCQHILAVLKS